MIKSQNEKNSKSSTEEIERLKKALKAVGGNNTQICTLYDLKVSTLRSWLHGKRAINVSALKEKLGINPEYIISGKEPMFIDNIVKSNSKIIDKNNIHKGITGVKFLTYTANANMKMTVNDIQELYEPDVKKSYKKSYVQVRISGDSMYPSIKNGWRCTFDTQLQPANDDIVVASINGVLVIKRYILDNGIICLKSDNPAFESYVANEFDNITIHGVVVELAIY